MALEKKPNAEPIRGYRLMEPLGSGGFGEVWKCEAPGGIFKAIKFVYGSLNGLAGDSVRAEEELRAVQLIKSIRHPFLLSIDRVESVGGELVIVTELADQNLDELLHQCREEGKPGIPRAELLTYLREAAEVLDLLNQQFDLQHLDIKPRNLFLLSNHVKVADFGLVSSLAAGHDSKIELGAITPLYAAPELFLGKISRHCDQYSLAIVFQELLRGTLPFAGKNSRQLLVQHTQGEPDLSSLSPSDRAIIGRALAKDPEQRYRSCMDLVRALTVEKVDIVESSDAEQPAATDVPAMAETVATGQSDTDRHRPRRPTLPPEVLPDHVFFERLQATPLFDFWKVKTPSAKMRGLRILYGLENPKLKQGLAALQSLHHPALVPSEVVFAEAGRVILLSDLVKADMRDRFSQCQAQNLPGIPRAELVDDIRAAAEVLDYMYQQHGVQHLGLNPRCLILDHGWLQITDFGLCQLVLASAGQDLARRNARYAAPELFNQTISRSSDQVSLGLIYAEMLTGVHPYRDKNPRQPELTGLPDPDREVIARALDQDPGKRFPSCTDMVLALQGIKPEEKDAEADHFISLLQEPRDGKLPPIPAGEYGDLHKIIADIIAEAGGEVSPQSLEEIPVLSEDGTVLSHQFQAGLPIGSAREKLAMFPHHCRGELMRDDETGCLVLVPMPAGFWGKWLGKQPALEVDIRLARVSPTSATPIEITATLRTVRANAKQSRQALEEVGPEIVDRLRQMFLVNSNKRTQSRLLWPHPITVIPLLHGERQEPITCRGKDLSQGGLGFYLPEALSAPDVLIELPNSIHEGVTIPATLVRARHCADGWYDVGALFRLPAVRKSSHDLCLT